VYWPGLFYVGDSFGYLDAALNNPWPAFDPAHPGGYPLLLWLLAAPGGFRLAVVVIVQHAAGLATGALVYALLVRLRVPPLAAAAASAVYLLASYPVVLEQHVLSEPFFTLTLVGSAYLAVAGRDGRAFVASGFLLGFAGLVRAVGLVATPALLLYALWRRRAPRVAAAAAAAAAVPVLAFSTAHALSGHGFGLSEWDGWILYGRVAPIADCAGADIPAGTAGVCESDAERARKRREGWTPSAYIFNLGSPAHRVLGPELSPEANSTLRAFALAIIRAHPAAYARMVVAETSAFFRPDRPLALDPGVMLHEHDDDLQPIREHPSVRRHVGEYRPRFRGPLDAVLWFDRNARPPRPLLALLALAPLAALAAALAGRGRLRLPHLAETVLLAITGYGQEDARAQCQAAGFDLHLTKPVDPHQLSAVLAGLPDPAEAR
jgi:hypothetical protein